MRFSILFLAFISLFSFGYSSQSKFAKIQSEYRGKIGVYTIDNNNHSNIKFNENFNFPICSVYKFLVVGAILKADMQEPILNKKITITENDIKDIGYTPFTSKNLNKNVSIQELAKATILSDNAAANILVKQLGGLTKLNEFIVSIGDDKTIINDIEPQINNININDNLNKTTPKAITRDLNKLAFGNILDKKHRLLLKKWLQQNNTGKNRIAHNIPKNWKIGDKTGTCEFGTTNDVAIVWPNNKKAITIAILYTQANKDAKQNDEILQKVTKILVKEIKDKKHE